MNNMYKTKLHELEKLESIYKFIYLLRDLGIRSSNEAATHAWKLYMHKISELAKQGTSHDDY